MVAVNGEDGYSDIDIGILVVGVIERSRKSTSSVSPPLLL